MSSFTPYAAFQGNQTAIVGRASETTPGKGDSALVRANGCALSQYSYPDRSASGSGSSFTFTGAEAYFRQLAGLAAVPASYPKGCTDRSLGITSTTSASLGQTADGDTLVAIADEIGKLTVTRISAEGVVVSQQNLAIGATDSQRFNAARTFAVADLNGDGLADIVSPYWTAPDGSAGVAVFLSQTSGAYAIPARGFAYAGAVFGVQSSVSIEDVDGDGKLDVVALAGAEILRDTLMTLKGNGSGGFTPGSTSIVTVHASGAPFVIADFTGDGRKSILTADGLYFAGAGNGSFAAPVQRLGIDPFPNTRYGPAVADFNADGTPDLVSLPRSGSGSGSGFPTSPSQLLFSPGSASGSFGAAVVAANVSFRPPMLTLGDFNGDGRADVVVAGVKLAVLMGLGNGSFGAEQAYALPGAGNSLVNLAVGDFNGDGRADAVVITGDCAFVYFANADGTLKAPVQIDNASNLGSVAVGDTDGDGRADLVVSGLDLQFYSSPNVLRGARVYRGNADGSFSAPLLLAPAAGSVYGAIAIGDMNKDGKPDLVLAGTTAAFASQVSVLPGNGDGTFGAASVYSLLDGNSITALTVGDFTFDGNPDVLVLRDGKTTEVLHGDGTGKIAVEIELAIAGGATYGVAADLNGDTEPDAVLAVGTAGIVPLLRTRQAIVAAAVTPTPTAPYTVSASSASGSVASGESVQTTLTFTFPAGFAETVGLACTGLPANATCSFAPASVVPSGGAGTTVLTIQTGRQAAAVAMLEPGGGLGDQPWLRSAALAALAALVAMGSITLLGVHGRFAGAVRVRRRLRYGTVVAMGLVAGCGGSGGSDGVGASGTTPGGTTQFVTPSGVYNIVVTASSTSGSQSVPYVLTVK